VIDVLGLGTLAVDEILSLESFPREDAKARVLARERRCGGLSGTALIAAARLGARCAYGGYLGDDADSDFLRAALSKEGVAIDAALSDAAARPFRGTIIIARDSGTRTILSERGRPGTRAVALPAARVALIDHHTPESILTALEELKRRGTQVLADLERDTPQAALADAIADHLIVPLAHARERTGTDDAGRAALALWRPWRRLVAVTDGSRGSWWTGDGAQVFHQAAVAARVRDTTGCGDVFHGAYAALLARGSAPEERLRWASAAAALKAASADGLPPRAAEVMAVLGPAVASIA
jgi:sugar/nucleoside kinase (ribokinase family)